MLKASVQLQSTQPTPIPQQPSNAMHGTSHQTRCQHCHVTGHDTTDCHTRDPVATKKRIASNQKIKQAANTIIPLSQNPVFTYPLKMLD